MLPLLSSNVLQAWLPHRVRGDGWRGSAAAWRRACSLQGHHTQALLLWLMNIVGQGHFIPAPDRITIQSRLTATGMHIPTINLQSLPPAASRTRVGLFNWGPRTVHAAFVILCRAALHIADAWT